MESPAENPSKAAEYLKELNKIIETQQELLEKQKRRIDELEQQVAKLYHENACLQDEHHRHLATCRLQQGVPPAYPGVLSAIQENAKHEKPIFTPDTAGLLCAQVLAVIIASKLE
ncbi:hypothetical protein CIB84_005327 [Bambusicola thoracicus]|uniref:Uncharacterized protein n=1 Tax=Bambusicola thoracicus TaxID=9083 RepID=A0A2P4T3J9_BAMTH|nr:hypothetical protein CIB84_005327 [Bambusicola thoracicus]